MRTGVTRQNSESGPTKEDNVRLKQQLTDIRIKLNDLEASVSEPYEKHKAIRYDGPSLAITYI